MPRAQRPCPRFDHYVTQAEIDTPRPIFPQCSKTAHTWCIFSLGNLRNGTPTADVYILGLQVFFTDHEARIWTEILIYDDSSWHFHTDDQP